MGRVAGLYGKRVKQLDYETNEVIWLYNSLDEAAEDNFITRKTIQYAINKNGGRVRKIFARFQVIERKDFSEMKVLADGIQPDWVKDVIGGLKLVAVNDGYDVRPVSDDAFCYRGDDGVKGFVYYDPYVQAIVEE